MSEREYRNMEFRLAESEDEKPSYKVEGYASTFDRYFLFEIDGEKIYEKIDERAFDETDFTDVVFRVDHTGPVYA